MSRKSKAKDILLPWLLTIAMFLIWEVGVRIFHIPSFILPTPSESIAVGWQYAGPIMGHAMQTRTIGEYAETPAIVEALRQSGVDFAQGYALAHPAPWPQQKAEAGQ